MKISLNVNKLKHLAQIDRIAWSVLPS